MTGTLFTPQVQFSQDGELSPIQLVDVLDPPESVWIEWFIYELDLGQSCEGVLCLFPTMARDQLFVNPITQWQQVMRIQTCVSQLLKTERTPSPIGTLHPFV